MVEVIEPSVTHSDFIHQLEVKESVPAEIFANMKNLDDCFKSSQVESQAWRLFFPDQFLWYIIFASLFFKLDGIDRINLDWYYNALLIS